MATIAEESSTSRPPPSSNAETSKRQPGELTEPEIFYRDHQVWLERRGYMLRSRYKPDWVPSWRGTDKNWLECFDGHTSYGYNVDAVRIRDNVKVALKVLQKKWHVRDVDGRTEGEFVELEIGRFFSSSPLAEDVHNHCVPILEVLEVPDVEDCWIMVMPLLRTILSPRFDTFGEAVDFFEQVFEGLKFMHEHNVAHRDCNSNNIMMDASKMFPDGYHHEEINLKPDFSGRARFYTRTQRPPKYYFIDFGISRKYSTRDPPPLEDPIEGGDKTVPEFNAGEPCDPFPTDVYYLGNMIRTDFLEGSLWAPKLRGFEFMKSLVDDMVSTDPAKRPTMNEVVVRFAAIKADLSSWKLRSRVVRDTDFSLPIHRIVAHWFRRLGFILSRTPAIPQHL